MKRRERDRVADVIMLVVFAAVFYFTIQALIGLIHIINK